LCAGNSSGALEAAQETLLGVDAGLKQFAQEDGGAEPHGVECDGQRRFLCDEHVDDMRHEGAHGRVIDTVDRGSHHTATRRAATRNMTAIGAVKLVRSRVILNTRQIDAVVAPRCGFAARGRSAVQADSGEAS
jgi:hypothetical protein